MKKRILLVHNDQTIFNLIRELLGGSYDVLPAWELSEALSKAERRGKPDLIIVGFYEERDTFSWYIWYIKELSRRVKVIVWSGYALEDFQPKCLSAGAFRCVTKSDTRGFLDAIEKALNN